MLLIDLVSVVVFFVFVFNCHLSHLSLDIGCLFLHCYYPPTGRTRWLRYFCKHGGRRDGDERTECRNKEWSILGFFSVKINAVYRPNASVKNVLEVNKKISNTTLVAVKRCETILAISLCCDCVCVCVCHVL